MGISKKEYLTGKPWKELQMSRAKFEKFILSTSKQIVTDSKLKSETDRMRDYIFNKNMV